LSRPASAAAGRPRAISPLPPGGGFLHLGQPVPLCIMEVINRTGGPDMVASDRLRIFAGSSKPELARRSCEALRPPLRNIKRSRFKSGERYCLYEETIRNSDVFLVQAFSHRITEHLMELLIRIDAAKRASARTINRGVPYYGSSRQERKTAPR